MPNVVFDASSPVGALLKQGSIPERALLLARTNDTLCLSAAVLAEIREVFGRPKFQPHLVMGRAEAILNTVTEAAMFVEPDISVADSRDAKDNKYLELALAGGATMIISSDADLLTLDPWRGIRIMTPSEYVANRTSGNC